MKTIMGLEGKYTIVVRGPDGGIKKQLEFKNLILNNGLNGIGTNQASAWHTTVGLGTGTSTPAVGDTSLSGTIISTGTTQSNTNGVVASNYGWQIITKRFAQGAAAGTWTEVGIGRATNNLWSRALILDGAGNPTSLVITSIDIVDIVYELRLYLSGADVTGSRTIGGVSTAYVIRPLMAIAPDRLWGGSWMTATAWPGFSGNIGDGALGAAYAPIGHIANANEGSSASTAPYVNNSYTKVATTNYGTNGANSAGGITAIAPFAHGNASGGGITPFKCGFSPAIAKTNAQTLSLSFSYTWARRP